MVVKIMHYYHWEFIALSRIQDNMPERVRIFHTFFKISPTSSHSKIHLIIICKPHHLKTDNSKFKMAVDLPNVSAYPPTSTPEPSSSAAVPITEDWERNTGVWSRIRADATERLQQYQLEKEKGDKTRCLLMDRRQLREQARDPAGLGTTSTTAMALSATYLITPSWSDEREAWAQILTYATQRYNQHQLEKEKEKERAANLSREQEAQNDSQADHVTR